MSEQLFDIIFKGETLESVGKIDAQENLSKLFKQSPEKIAKQYFSQPCYLKKSLNRETATKYQAALKKAGLKIYIKEQKKTPVSQQPKTTQPVAAQTVEPEETYGFSLAPMEGNLLKAAEQKVSIINELDLSAYSLAAQEGYLVNPTELPPRDYPLIEIPDFDLVPMK